MVLPNFTLVSENTSNKFDSIAGTVCHKPSSTIHKHNAFDGRVTAKGKKEVQFAYLGDSSCSSSHLQVEVHI